MIENFEKNTVKYAWEKCSLTENEKRLQKINLKAKASKYKRC